MRARAIRIVVKNSRGRVVKTFRPTTRVTATWCAVKWHPKAEGTYRYSVYAKDVAGNAQANVASNKLKVK